MFFLQENVLKGYARRLIFYKKRYRSQLYISGNFSIEKSRLIDKRLLINSKYHYQNFHPKLTIGNLSSFDTV